MPCACGRPFVPDPDYYHAHVQTGEHQRWRIRVIERGTLDIKEVARELFGVDFLTENRELTTENVPGMA